MDPVRALGLLGFLLLVQNAAATQFTVGGSVEWSVPLGDTAVYNQWAERMRFQIGDSLLFIYPSNTDSVLRVSKDDYTSCNTTSPLEKHKDGHTVFTFSQSGPHYFISGNKDNCLKNEKLVVVVLANRNKKALAPPLNTPPGPVLTPPLNTPPGPVLTPPLNTPPAPVLTPPSETPPPAPSTTIPSPPPTTEQMPYSPPPQAPFTESPPLSDASSIAKSIVGSVGALIGSAALVAL